MKKELSGQITKSMDFDCICIGETFLADFAKEIDGKVATLNYYLSSTPINKDTAIECFLHSFYQGLTEADGLYCVGSSWTGVYAKNDEFSVGGHDIINELSGHLWKFCYLVVETID